MRTAWHRLVAWGFRRLYNELAWLYDPVSWLASLGLWRRWQQAACLFVPGPGSQVLELGFGPGHLLLALARGGYQVTGLDPSPAMVRRAACRLHRAGQPALVCRGRAGNMPFAPGLFDAVVATFPTPYIYESACLQHLARVLRGPGSRLIVVEQATLQRRTVPARGVELLYQATGQRGPAPDLVALLAQVELRAWRESVPVEGTVVGLVVAEK